MGFFDGMKLNKLGRDAYNAHVQGNDFQRRGRVAEAQAKYNEAMKLYAEAYQAGCRKTGILMSYSVLMMRDGKFEQARELMKEISQIGGMNEDTHFELRVNYSICLWRMGILDKAIETIRYAGKHCKNSSYYSILGTCLVELAGQTGDFAEAKAFLDEAMDYDDEDAATLDNLGEYCRLLSLKKKAEAEAPEAEVQPEAEDAEQPAEEAVPEGGEAVEETGVQPAQPTEAETEAGEQPTEAGEQPTAGEKKADLLEEAAKLRAQSKDYFERALKAKAGQITTLYALAKFEIEDGNTTRARELIDKAIMHSGSRVCPVSIEELQAMKAQLN